MAKLQFVRVEGYTWHYCHFENGDEDDAGFDEAPVIGLYIDQEEGVTEKVLTVHGIIYGLEGYCRHNGFFTALQCPDGKFSGDGGSIWDTKEEWVKYAHRREKEFEIYDLKAELDLPERLYKLTESGDQNARRVLIDEFGFGLEFEWTLENTAAISERINELGY